MLLFDDSFASLQGELDQKDDIIHALELDVAKLQSELTDCRVGCGCFVPNMAGTIHGKR